MRSIAADGSPGAMRRRLDLIAVALVLLVICWLTQKCTDKHSMKNYINALQGQLQQKNAAVVGAGGGRLPAPGDDDLVRSAGAMRARHSDGAIVRPYGRHS